MRKYVFRLALLMLASTSLLGVARGRHRDKAVTKKDEHMIVVVVREKENALEFQIGTDRYNGKQAAFALGELRLTHEANAPVVVIIDDRVRMAGLSSVPSMAIDAGFTNIHTYVLWPHMGRMAEVQFGPVVSFSKHPAVPADSSDRSQPRANDSVTGSAAE
jgi:hypothetical protein